MKHIAFVPVLLVAFVSSYSTISFAAEEPKLQASEEALQWFRDAKFGLFIHWGPVSLKGTEIGWSRGGERKYPQGKGEIPVEVYDNLYKKFNPVEFDADEWVRIAQDAGMKYLVFTTKHHDGFCMFDSELTDYKITNSPFGRDVVAELAKACHEAGLKLGFYYSPPDWHHPDYWTEDHEQYIEYMHGQVKELCTDYGRLDILWFDGLGAPPERWGARELIPEVRRLQRGILINNRSGLPADFDTPEQRVGRFQNDRAWESCITICRQWAWKPDDKMKSLKECIDILVRSVGGDGNLLLNVGPKPNGEIERRQVERLKEIGEWLNRYGESIYGARGGPFITSISGASTYKGNTVYLHILDWEDSDIFVLSPLPRKIRDSRVLTGGEAEVTQTDDEIRIVLPKENQNPIDTIIALELDGPAGRIAPVPLKRSTSLAAFKKAETSNVHQSNTWRYGPDKAFDEDLSTRWATDSGVSEAWITVDLEKKATFDRVILFEEYDRVGKFRLLYKDDGEWIPLHEGTSIGEKETIDFEPVTARFVRLHILQSSDGPTIKEMQVVKKR